MGSAAHPTKHDQYRVPIFSGHKRKSHQEFVKSLIRLCRLVLWRCTARLAFWEEFAGSLTSRQLWKSVIVLFSRVLWRRDHSELGSGYPFGGGKDSFEHRRGQQLEALQVQLVRSRSETCPRRTCDLRATRFPPDRLLAA